MWRSAALLALAACASKKAPDASVAAGEPYGTWSSTVTAADAIAADHPPRELTVTADATYWIAPDRAGKHPLMRRDRQGAITVVAPDVATEAHAYGGGAYALAGDDAIVSNAGDGRLYRVGATATTPLTPEGNHHWADCVHDAARARMLCVHDDATPAIPVDTIDAVTLDGEVTRLVEGHDFFASPKLSPDGQTLAWVSWDFPRMPWDGSDVWTAPVNADGTIGAPVHVAGGERESAQQPAWSPDGVLHYVSDRGGAWAIYRADRADPISPPGGEVLVGWQAPGALLDEPAFAFAGDGHLVFTYVLDGVDQAAVLELASGAARPLGVEGVTLALAAGGGRVAVVIGHPDRAPTLSEIDLATWKVTELGDPVAAPTHVSKPETIRFPTDDGAVGEAYFYRPVGAASAPAGERPPLIVQAHGGPTARTTPTYSAAIQYWTTRGFAVVDVNYGGSVGYGRAYRERLSGRAGVVDVADCVAAAHFLALRGDVDRARLAIRGGSSGGYTAIMASTRPGFRSAAAWAGYSDIEALDRDTAASDKFESHYDEMLIGPYPAMKDVYVARSPIHHPEAIVTPILFVHGDGDPVVPISQSRTLYDALVKLAKPAKMIELVGAGHATGALQDRAKALEAELAWHRRNLPISP